FVHHAGKVHFQDNADGSTTVDIKMVYNPVAGAVGHAIARLFGTDPKHQMDDDLLRVKSFLETGKLPRDAAGQGMEVPPALKEIAREHGAGGNGAGQQGGERERVRPGGYTSPVGQPHLPAAILAGHAKITPDQTGDSHTVSVEVLQQPCLAEAQAL